MLAVTLVGEHPRWAAPVVNLTEAAAVRDTAEISRLLEQGDDPNQRRPVRPGLIGNDVERQATPLEAGISIGRPDVLRLLLEHGASPSPSEWRRLRCAAQALQHADVVAALDAHRPVAPGMTCRGDELLW